MITVSILINGQPIYTRSAVNVTDNYSQERNEKNIYELDTGVRISHVPKDGAVKLAKKMLDTIKEKRR